MFYGSFGAGIATLVWIYIVCFSVLLGAEFNGVLYEDRQDRLDAELLMSSPEREGETTAIQP
jgi:membrane protein